MKSLVELQRLEFCKLFGVDVRIALVEELGTLFRVFPISAIKLLN